MLAFDKDAPGDEPNSERMNFRTSARVKRTIRRAAALAGVDDTAFVVSAAYRSAMATIAAHETTALATIDHEAFFAALDTPPEPTQALRDAFARHGRSVISR